MSNILRLSQYLTDYRTANRALIAMFSAARAGDTLIIEPGDYSITQTVPLTSDITVRADNAVFRFPEQLPEDYRIRMFYGKDIHGLRWIGGCFAGHVYNPASAVNLWEPNSETLGIVIEGGSDLHFERISGRNTAGSVILCDGCEEQPIRNVELLDLDLINCGRFMWDYGYLWQRITFPENHTPEEVANARRYMPAVYQSGPLTFDGERILSDTMPPRQVQDDAVTFFGESLPANIVRGKFYYAEPDEDGALRIRESLDSPFMRFEPVRCSARLFRGIYQVYHAMYAPAGGGSSKGGADIRHAVNVTMKGCRISAPGDAMHIHFCENVLVENNIIEGARMGAMFISAHCHHVIVRGNLVDGGNCSRVLTVETGGRDVLIEHNIFKNGGRGSWIDTPDGITLRRNFFIGNTKKCTPDPAIGRLSPTAGTYEKYGELYFTTRTHGAIYGNITLEGNCFITEEGCSAGVVFNGHGRTIRVEGNIFEGPCRTLYVSPVCEDVTVAENSGGPVTVDSVANEAFDIPGTIYLR